MRFRFFTISLLFVISLSFLYPSEILAAGNVCCLHKRRVMPITHSVMQNRPLFSGDITSPEQYPGAAFCKEEEKIISCEHVNEADDCDTDGTYVDQQYFLAQTPNPYLVNNILQKINNSGYSEQCKEGLRTATINTTHAAVDYGIVVTCSQEPACEGTISATYQNCQFLSKDNCKRDCFYDGAKCQSKFETSICTKLPQQYCDGSENASKVCGWDKNQKGCVQAIEAFLGQQYQTGGKILPPCAFTGSCRNIDDLLLVAINLANDIFSIMGVIALGFFVGGGVTMIASFGNTERFKKGQQILIAALVGIIISFSAYLLVSYILNALGINGAAAQQYGFTQTIE